MPAWLLALNGIMGRFIAPSAAARNPLFCFLMSSVFLAEWAVFFKLYSTGGVFFVFSGCVVAAFAVRLPAS